MRPREGEVTSRSEQEQEQEGREEETGEGGVRLLRRRRLDMG